MENNEILEIKNLKKYFPVKEGLFRKTVADVKAVDDVSFSVKKNETFGIAGESGCGKSTLIKSITQLLKPTAGEIQFRSDIFGDEDSLIDLNSLSESQIKKIRKEIQVIFQDPNSSLNPRMSIKGILSEPFKIHGNLNKNEIEIKCVELLESVGLESEHLNRYPHEFSGGQKQRIGVARALALNPKLIFCDEPVSALDVSIQGQMLNLLENLQDEYDLTYVFIAHDLSVMYHICDRIAIMYLGKIVETASTLDLFTKPLHPYTESLLAAVPRPDPKISMKHEFLLKGNVPSPINPPAGCSFNPRCPYATEKCKIEEPELKKIDGRYVACHRAEELNLKGIEYSNIQTVLGLN